MNMKMRTVFSLLIVLCIVSTLNPTMSFAQTNYIYWTSYNNSLGSVYIFLAVISIAAK